MNGPSKEIEKLFKDLESYANNVTRSKFNSTAVSLEQQTKEMFNQKPKEQSAVAINAAKSSSCSKPDNCSVAMRARTVRQWFAAWLFAILLGTWPAPAEPVVLAWDYPTNELVGIVFRVRMTPTVPMPFTNWVTLTETTNTTVRLDMVPAVYYFAVTASNFWSKAESPFSNIVFTPPVVKTNVSFTITKP